jgi:hypothetical protein
VLPPHSAAFCCRYDLKADAVDEHAAMDVTQVATLPEATQASLGHLTGLVASVQDSAFRRSACLNCCAKLAFTVLNCAESCAEDTHILPLNAAELLQEHTDTMAPPTN